jgi:hypothetical protein
MYTVMIARVAGALIVWQGLSVIDMPVEASLQQRHMLIGREEVHFYTCMQVQIKVTINTAG